MKRYIQYFLVIYAVILLLLLCAQAISDPTRQTIICPMREVVASVFEKQAQKRQLKAAKDERDTLLVLETHSGDELDDVIAHLRTAEMEALVAFDIYGDKMFDVTANMPDRVHPTESLLEYFQTYDGKFLLHNHPSGKSFSGQDLWILSSYQIPVGIIVTSDKLYIVQNINSGCTDGDFEHYAKQIQEFYDVESILTNVKLAPTTKDEAKVVDDLTTRSTAQQFGFTYKCIDLE